MSQIEVDTILPQSSNTLTFGNANTTVSVIGTLDGNQLANINADNIASGTVADARLSSNVTLLGQSPTYSSISPTAIEPNTASNINILGTGFTATTVFEFVNTTGSIIKPDTVTLNSSSNVTASANVSVTGDYYIRIENDSGLATRSTNADLQVSTAPVFSTAAGTLGTFNKGDAVNVAITASSDSAVDFSVQSGTLPTGLSLGSTQNTVYIAGTESSAITATTTYNFTIRATDQESQTSDRAFSITINVGITEGMRFS